MIIFYDSARSFPVANTYQFKIHNQFELSAIDSESPQYFDEQNK